MADEKPTTKEAKTTYVVESGQNYRGLPAGTLVLLTEAEAIANKDVIRELRRGEEGFIEPAAAQPFSGFNV